MRGDFGSFLIPGKSQKFFVGKFEKTIKVFDVALT
jgi:hypothetical protein